MRGSTPSRLNGGFRIAISPAGVLLPRRPGRKPRVACERGLFKDIDAEACKFALVLDAEEYGAAIAGLEGSIGHDGGVMGARAGRRLAAIAGEVGREPHPFAQSLEHRDLERC